MENLKNLINILLVKSLHLIRMIPRRKIKYHCKFMQIVAHFKNRYVDLTKGILVFKR